MLNGDCNENGLKKKQTNFALATCSTLFGTFLCRCFTQLQREISQLYVLFRKRPSVSFRFFHCRSFSCCGHQYFLYSHRRFHVFLSTKFVSFISLSLSLALSLLSMSVQTLKFSGKKKTRLRHWLSIHLHMDGYI